MWKSVTHDLYTVLTALFLYTILAKSAPNKAAIMRMPNRME